MKIDRSIVARKVYDIPSLRNFQVFFPMSIIYSDEDRPIACNFNLNPKYFAICLELRLLSADQIASCKDEDPSAPGEAVFDFLSGRKE